VKDLATNERDNTVTEALFNKTHHAYIENLSKNIKSIENGETKDKEEISLLKENPSLLSDLNKNHNDFFIEHKDILNDGFTFIFNTLEKKYTLSELKFYELKDDETDEKYIEIVPQFINLQEKERGFDPHFFDKKDYKTTPSLQLKLPNDIDTSEYEILETFLGFWNFSLKYLKAIKLGKSTPVQQELFKILTPSTIVKAKRTSVLPIFRNSKKFMYKKYAKDLDKKLLKTGATLKEKIDYCMNIYRKLQKEDSLYFFIKLLGFVQSVSNHVKETPDSLKWEIEALGKEKYRIRTHIKTLYPHFLQKKSQGKRKSGAVIEKYQATDKKKLIEWLEKNSKSIPFIGEEDEGKRPYYDEDCVFKFRQYFDTEEIAIEVNTKILLGVVMDYMRIDLRMIDEAHILWKEACSNNKIIKKHKLQKQFSYLPLAFLNLLQTYINPNTNSISVKKSTFFTDIWDLGETIIYHLKKSSGVKKGDKKMESYLEVEDVLLTIIFKIALEVKEIKAMPTYDRKTDKFTFILSHHRPRVKSASERVKSASEILSLIEK
jgi:hypothetical protein